VAAVKRRTYDNSRRLAQARATRTHVAQTAHRLFLERGYPGTTIEAIAQTAGIPLATVFRLFGNKRGILAAVLDLAFGGDDEPVAFHERAAVRSALAELDPWRLVEAFAGICRELLDRSSAIQEVVRSAAAVDAEAADMLAVSAQQRLTGQARVAKALADRGALAGGIDLHQATDIIYMLMSPEVHRILTVERGWSGDEYQRWLARALRAMLLGDAAPAKPRQRV